MKILSINPIKFNKLNFKSIRNYYNSNNTYHTLPIPVDVFDKTSNSTRIIGQDKGNFKVLFQKDNMNAVVEIEEKRNNKDTSTTVSITREHGGTSLCKYKEGRGPKSKKMYLRWTYPYMNFKFSGKDEELKKFKGALQNVRNIISSDEFSHDLGTTRSLNDQLKAAINYLQGRIEATSGSAK